MNKPLVSIIIIGYNIEKYICGCINSALSQDYSEIEIIFVDDGSKDRTLELAKNFQSQNNIKIIAKANGGIVSARKEGLKNAIGEFVCFVDGDDWLNPEMVTSLMKRASTVQYDVDIVSSSFNWQTSEGDFFSETNKIKIDKCSGYEFFEHIMLDEIDHHMFPRIYRMQFLIDAGYLTLSNVTMAEDLMTNAFLGLYQPRVLFSDSVNYYYRYNTSSTIRKGNAKLLEQAKTLEFLKKYIKKFDYPNSDKLIEFQWFSYAMCYVKYPEHVSIKKKIIQLCKKNTKNIYENKYVKKVFNESPKRYKILFEIYYKCPLLAEIVDPLFFKAINLFKTVRAKKRAICNKRFFNKMSSYYKAKTQKIMKESNKDNFYLIGTSDRSNIGDHIIALSEYKFLQSVFPDKNIIEITGDHYRHDKIKLEKVISKNSPIFITGGGFLGDLWMDEENLVRDVISRYPKNNIIIFPQTIHFNNRYDPNGEYWISQKIYTAHKRLLMLAREEKSLYFLRDMLPDNKTELYPDMALLLDENIKNIKKSKSALMCFRKDKESALSGDIETNLIKQLKYLGYQIKMTSTLNIGKNEGDIRIEDREQKVIEKLKEFAEAEIVITDRLHGMIIATLAGTRCIAMNNSSRKVEGVYNNWLKGRYNVEVVDESYQLLEAILHILEKNNVVYNVKIWDDWKNKLAEQIKEFIGEGN